MLDQMLCLKFCAYNKPGKNDELACRGYLVVEQLMQAGKVIAFQKSEQALDNTPAEMLIQKMCTACDFYDHDCDFMQNHAAPPCGGFVLLSQLLAEKVITIEDIT